jgi:hypothetical protein
MIGENETSSACSGKQRCSIKRRRRKKERRKERKPIAQDNYIPMLIATVVTAFSIVAFLAYTYK